MLKTFRVISFRVILILSDTKEAPKEGNYGTNLSSCGVLSRKKLLGESEETRNDYSSVFYVFPLSFMESLVPGCCPYSSSASHFGLHPFEIYIETTIVTLGPL